MNSVSLAALLVVVVSSTAAAQERPPGTTAPTAAPGAEAPPPQAPPTAATPEAPPPPASPSPPAPGGARAAREAASPRPAPSPPRPPPPPPLGVLSRVPGLSLGGYVQADWLKRDSSLDELDPSTGEPLNQDRFLIRRARVRLHLDRPWVTGGVELDGNTVKGVQARLIAAEATFRFPPPEGGVSPASLTAGLFKIPFGFEVVQSDRDRLFVERSAVARALFPGEHDLGAQLAGGWAFLRWAAALQNGNPSDDKSFPGRDPNSAKDLVLRGGIDVTAGSRVRLVGGVSYLKGKGFHAGTTATKDTFQWRDMNENGVIDSGEIQVVPGRPATPSSDFDRSAFGADARLVVAWPWRWLGATEIGAEIMAAKNLDRGFVPADPVSSGRDLRELGWYVLASQEIGPYLQVGVRYDTYNPDRNATDSRVGKVVPSDAGTSTLALALVLRPPGGYGRIVAEYDRNRNHLGRDATGVPTNLKDDAVVVRAEVKF